MTDFTDSVGLRTKRQRRSITEASNPNGKFIDHSELQVGMLVWGRYSGNDTYYLGIMCVTHASC